MFFHDNPYGLLQKSTRSFLSIDRRCGSHLNATLDKQIQEVVVIAGPDTLWPVIRPGRMIVTGTPR